MPDDDTYQTLADYMKNIKKKIHEPRNLHDMANNLSKLTIGDQYNDWADKIIENLKDKGYAAHHTINKDDNRRPFTIYFSKRGPKQFLRKQEQGPIHKIDIGYMGQSPLTEVAIYLDKILFEPTTINSAIYNMIKDE
ncbi:MAG: hypothetical protein GQ477_03600 [Nanohaloarchaea archaeon]|nr:hypothetical protein [Candidatus Nanohaloarchaea archaeon]